MGQQDMRVPRRGHKHARQVNKCPRFGLEIEIVEVIELACPIVPSKQVHLVVEDSRRGTIATLGPHAIAPDLLPHIRLEVVLVQIVAVVAIVATKHVHVVFIDDTGVGVTWAGTRI